ncbi:NAD(P) transhydrogenase subunit alpha [Thermomicrobiaceae bacterium CFH 74404]|uniref:proton-translocating NAD(P)(+) transhydrogenase n=1 Tax=Thermalbibacter longus TaxID=2951981 RepID=A0AA41WB74_9BACT|nr:NAD(P) transhydrogenase subunit alpha [Thermalbibacter longus]MCM8748387.1 NAD(P) transhydrogenase subunit alpha [Thermalbibacter longus]
MNQELLLGLYVLILTIFLGFEVISRVPSLLHTPLMSGTNAIHGIVLLGGILVAGTADRPILYLLGFLGCALGAGNLFGGLVVTDRMLEMFKPRPAEKPAGEPAPVGAGVQAVREKEPVRKP